MKRSDLEKRTIKTLEADNWTCERAYNKAVFIPNKGYVGRRFDFFHVVDIIAIKSTRIRFIQVTSSDADRESKHHSKNGSDSVYSHKVKIEKYWTFDIPIELWTYEKIRGRWALKIEAYQERTWEKGITRKMTYKIPIKEKQRRQCECNNTTHDEDKAQIVLKSKMNKNKEAKK